MARRRKDFKAKVRQLSFNLRDAKNPDLRSSVASGEIAADVLIDLAPEELGSNERRKANEKIREHAEWEAVPGNNNRRARTPSSAASANNESAHVLPVTDAFGG